MRTIALDYYAVSSYGLKPHISSLRTVMCVFLKVSLTHFGVSYVLLTVKVVRRPDSCLETPVGGPSRR